MYPTDSNRETHYVQAIKRRTGIKIAGTTEWDGLSDLVTVTAPDGTANWVSLPLDTIIEFERV